MKRRIAAIITALIMSLGGAAVLAAAPAQASTATVLPCVSNTTFDLNNHYGGLHFNGGFFVEGNPTDLCLNDASSTFLDTTIRVVGTSNCVTYNGPRGGPGDLDEVTCDPTKASEIWTWNAPTGGAGTVTNGYASGCLTGKVAGGIVGMNACNGNASQQNWKVTGS